MLVFVPEEGLEPSILTEHDFESCVYTIPPLRQYDEFTWISFLEQPVFLAL